MGSDAAALEILARCVELHYVPIELRSDCDPNLKSRTKTCLNQMWHHGRLSSGSTEENTLLQQLNQIFGQQHRQRLSTRKLCTSAGKSCPSSKKLSKGEPPCIIMQMK